MELAAVEKLTGDLKQKLKITWENEKTNQEILDLIEDAELYLNHLLGAETDYSVPGIFHKVFLNYCLYAWNSCENEFLEAYQSDIIQCQNYNQVMRKRVLNEKTESTVTNSK